MVTCDNNGDLTHDSTHNYSCNAAGRPTAIHSLQLAYNSSTGWRVPLIRAKELSRIRLSWAVRERRFLAREGCGPGPLEISRGIALRWSIVPPAIDSAPTATMILPREPRFCAGARAGNL